MKVGGRRQYHREMVGRRALGLVAALGLGACGHDHGDAQGSTQGTGGSGGGLATSLHAASTAGSGPSSGDSAADGGTGGGPPPATCPSPVDPVDVSQPDAVVGTGTPDSCTEAALETALAGGGVIVFDCGDAPLTITVTSEKAIATDTVLDGGGLVTPSGGGSTRILHVASAWD